MNKEDIVMDNTGENEVAVDSLESDFIDPKTKKPMRKTLVFMLIYGKDGLLARKIRTMVVILKNSHILGSGKIVKFKKSVFLKFSRIFSESFLYFLTF